MRGFVICDVTKREAIERTPPTRCGGETTGKSRDFPNWQRFKKFKKKKRECSIVIWYFYVFDFFLSQKVFCCLPMMSQEDMQNRGYEINPIQRHGVPSVASVLLAIQLQTTPFSFLRFSESKICNHMNYIYNSITPKNYN